MPSLDGRDRNQVGEFSHETPVMPRRSPSFSTPCRLLRSAYSLGNKSHLPKSRHRVEIGEGSCPARLIIRSQRS
jgi:hypothetical protein